MPRVSVILSLVLLLLLFGTVVLYVPLNPALSVAFTVTTDPVKGPVLIINNGEYQKLSLAASASIRKGVLSLSYASSLHLGKYYGLFTVSYGGKTISSLSGTLADGYFQARIVYWPMVEQTNVPYIVFVGVATSPNQTFAGSSVTIYPS
ncbi:MAG: hypothetical protein WB643_10330 [Candidatus Bathyarchaeia archaeon]